MENAFDKKEAQQYEAGEKVIDFRTLVKFTDILQVELFDLFADYDPPQKNDPLTGTV